MHPDHIYLPVLSGPPPLLWPLPKQKKKKKGKKYKVQAVLPIYSLEHGQIPSGQSLKSNRLQYKQWG